MQSVHGPGRVADGLALGDEDRGEAVGPAAGRERGVAGGGAAVGGDGGVEAEDWFGGS